MTQLNIPLDSANGDRPTELAEMPIAMYHMARHGFQEMGSTELLPFKGYDEKLSLLSYREGKEPAVTMWLSTSRRLAGWRRVRVNTDLHKIACIKLAGSFMTLEAVGKDHLPGQTVYVYVEAR